MQSSIVFPDPSKLAAKTQVLAQHPGARRVSCLSPAPCVPTTLSSFSGRQVSRRRGMRQYSVTPGTEEQRSPTDAPQEWETPAPSRRPDIFPEFEKMERVFLPKPLPGDPEMPDEEADEAKKRTFPGDPDPEQKPGEPAEPDQPEEEEGTTEGDPEKSGDTPQIPE